MAYKRSLTRPRSVAVSSKQSALPDRRIFTVTELTTLVRGQLEAAFPDIWVEGEISNLRIPPSGHFYFSLKDQKSQVRAVMFRAGGRRLKFLPADGQAILARGRLTVYEPRGEYQLIVDYLEPVGLGALQAAFEQLKERLAAEGLFDPSRKRPLPLLPRCIGIVTSPTGAAIRDMLTVLARRFANVQVLINPVSVQGDEAAAQIAAAIDELNAIGGVDVMIVGRGGGSLEDLWAFNEEIVARAISRSTIPIISAVGHETDVTISDFVADLRAPTPSAAAELVVQTKAELVGQVGQLCRQLGRAVQLQIARWRDGVREERRALLDPKRTIEAALLRIDDLDDRLRVELRRMTRVRRERSEAVVQRFRACAPLRLIRQMLDRATQLGMRLERQGDTYRRTWRMTLEHMVAQLNGLSPLSILARGYSIVQRLPDGLILRSVRSVTVESRLRLRLHEGELRVRVDEVIPHAATQSRQDEFDLFEGPTGGPAGV